MSTIAGDSGKAYEGTIVGLYDLLETIGSGNFAVVKRARHVFTGEIVAIKIIDKIKLDEAAHQRLYQEILCLKLAQHPNIVRLYEAIDTHTKLYLVLEYGDGGDLEHMLMNLPRGLPIWQAREYFCQIARAVAYCHSRHVVHRDLKPENVVLFKKQGVVKLTDFGLGSRYSPDAMLTTSCGSLAYSAPEILLGDDYDAQSIDVWSLGALLYTLVCGRPPFMEESDSETVVKIMDCQYSVPTAVPALCGDLIRRMLQRTPSQRLALQDVVRHPWVTGSKPAGGETEDCTSKKTPSSAITPPGNFCLQQLSTEERDALVQLMIDGGIADRKEILRNLDEDNFSHVTATFYLLADRLLKKKKLESASSEVPPAASTNVTKLAPPKQQFDATDASTSDGSVRGDVAQIRENFDSGELFPLPGLQMAARKHEVLMEEDEEELSAPGSCRMLSVHKTKSFTAVSQHSQKVALLTPNRSETSGRDDETGATSGTASRETSRGSASKSPSTLRSSSSPNIQESHATAVDKRTPAQNVQSRLDVTPCHPSRGADSKASIHRPSAITFENARKLLELENVVSAQPRRHDSSTRRVGSTARCQIEAMSSHLVPPQEQKAQAQAHPHQRTVGVQTRITGVRLRRLTARSVVDPSQMFCCEPTPACDRCVAERSDN